MAGDRPDDNDDDKHDFHTALTTSRQAADVNCRHSTQSTSAVEPGEEYYLELRAVIGKPAANHTREFECRMLCIDLAQNKQVLMVQCMTETHMHANERQMVAYGYD